MLQTQNEFILSPFFLDQPLAGLSDIFVDVSELNAPAIEGGDAQARMLAYHVPLADMVYRTLGNGMRPVSVCGDCCATIAVLAGMQRAGIFPLLVWFDAHGDFNTFEISASGFLGGMPLAMIVGRGEQELPQAVGLVPVRESNVYLCDARDLDPPEATALRSSQVNHIRDIDTLIDALPPETPIYVHFDCDVICSDEAPAHNYPAALGPGSEQVAKVFTKLNQTGRVVAASLSTWNPALDKSGDTARVVTKTFDALIRNS